MYSTWWQRLLQFNYVWCVDPSAFTFGCGFFSASLHLLFLVCFLKETVNDCTFIHILHIWIHRCGHLMLKNTNLPWCSWCRSCSILLIVFMMPSQMTFEFYKPFLCMSYDSILSGSWHLYCFDAFLFFNLWMSWAQLELLSLGLIFSGHLLYSC